MECASEKCTQTGLSKKNQKVDNFLTIRDHFPPLNSTPDYSLVVIKGMWGIIGGKTLSNTQDLFSNWLDKTIANRPQNQ